MCRLHRAISLSVLLGALLVAISGGMAVYAVEYDYTYDPSYGIIDDDIPSATPEQIQEIKDEKAMEALKKLGVVVAAIAVSGLAAYLNRKKLFKKTTRSVKIAKKRRRK